MSVVVRAPAKVNLQLSVGPLRDDGFHELVSVFHAVSLVDVVTAQRGEGVQVRCAQQAVVLFVVVADVRVTV